MTGTERPHHVAYRRAAEYVATAATIALVITVIVVAARNSGRPSAADHTTVPGTTAGPTISSTGATSPPTTPTTSATPAMTTTTTRSSSTSVPTPTPTPVPTAVPPSLAGRDVEYLPGTGRVVALTFDAGANADGVQSIVDTLRREGVSATFFLTGDFAARFPGPSTTVAAAGHRLGNHSVDHPHFPALTDAAVHAQLAGAERTIGDVTGHSPRPLFRFPFGDRDQRTIATVNAAGYVAVRWTVDSLGWKGTSGGMTVDTVTARVLGALRPGAIVLMHVGSNPDDHTTLDAAALPAVIAGVRAAGYGFTTLDALLD